MKIFINPGHAPGIDPGAVNEDHAITEADVVLKIGTYLREFLEKEGHEVYLLQSNNLHGEDPAHQNICRTANKWNAGIFVSIHCNAHTSKSAHGAEVLIYRRWSRAESLAHKVQRNIILRLGLADRGVKERPGLAVLQDTTMPAILVETAFISNDEEAHLLSSYPQQFAMAIAEGILEWIHDEQPGASK